MAALVAAVLVAQPASAALLTYEATGVVDFLYNNPGNPLPQTWSESGLGQRLTVDFTIDTATPVSGIFTNTVGGPVTGNSYARGAVTVTSGIRVTSAEASCANALMGDKAVAESRDTIKLARTRAVSGNDIWIDSLKIEERTCERSLVHAGER